MTACRTLAEFVESIFISLAHDRIACYNTHERNAKCHTQAANQKVFTKDKDIEAQKSKSDANCAAFAFSPQTERTVFADESLSAFYLVAVLVIVDRKSVV